MFSPAASEPETNSLPTVRFVRVRKREWSWFESSFMAQSNDPPLNRAMPFDIAFQKASPSWYRSSRTRSECFSMPVRKYVRGSMNAS